MINEKDIDLIKTAHGESFASWRKCRGIMPAAIAWVAAFTKALPGKQAFPAIFSMAMKRSLTYLMATGC